MATVNRNYVIISTGEVAHIDFDTILEDSAGTLRYNSDDTKTFVKYEGTKPSFLNGKTTYTHAEIRVELAKEEWIKDNN